MSKSTEYDTVYKIDPHSIKKHKILVEYLKPWFHILSKHNEVVQYIDCFAGAGEYENSNVKGSPIIALECLRDHVLSEKMATKKFNMVFIEKNKKRAATLQENIDSMKLPENVKTHVVKDTFENVMNKFFGLEGTPQNKMLVPTFAFIDPFGYAHIPMAHVRRILETPKCEVMINLMIDNAKRNSFTEMHDESIDRLFGCHDWVEVRNIPKEEPEERNEFLANLYLKELTKNLDDEFKFTLQFKMINKVGHESYRLVFATKNPLGLKLMKEAMWKVDNRGSYTFDDRLSGQTFLVDFANEKAWVCDAAEHLSARFKGTSKTREEIENYILLETAWIYRASILKKLENEGKIEVRGRERTNTYPEGCKITFREMGKYPQITDFF